MGQIVGLQRSRDRPVERIDDLNRSREHARCVIRIIPVISPCSSSVFDFTVFLSSATAQDQCGGSFSTFLEGIRREALLQGYDRRAVEAFLIGAAQDKAVLRADRAQGIFQLPFIDFARRVISANRSVERTSVYEIMTKPALTLSAEMNIKYAIRLLARLGVRRALVTKGGDVVGFVSQRDMVMRYVDDGEEK